MAPTSAASLPDKPPPLAVRWLRPQTATAYLDLPTAPITLSVQKEVPWQAFTAEESKACEAAWQSLSEEEKRKSEEYSMGNGSTSEGKSSNVDAAVEEDEDTVGVSIARDKLFEVDVKRMRVRGTRSLYGSLAITDLSIQLRPIYWKLNTPPIPVVRATWMYDEACLTCIFDYNLRTRF